MKNILKILTLSLVMIGACKSPSGGDNQSELADTSTPYNSALKQATDEAMGLQLKNLSPDRELTKMLQMDTKNWNSFQKLRYGHTILMFLKDKNITEDDTRTKPRPGQALAPQVAKPDIDTTVFYGAPVE